MPMFGTTEFIFRNQNGPTCIGISKDPGKMHGGYPKTVQIPPELSRCHLIPTEAVEINTAQWEYEKERVLEICRPVPISQGTWVAYH